MSERLSNVVRRKFVEYFTHKHGHKFVRSSPVLPHNDKSLTFTNAGMNQFKPYFLQDHGDFPYSRVCNYQKCIRVGGKLCDLSQIGYDLQHHTFFEMLGNWSFNDYGKQEACEWALDFLVNDLKLDFKKIMVTYFSDEDREDLETKMIWQSLGLLQDQIIATKNGENFWEMSTTGPCGLSTEIFYPIGSNQVPVEIWNLVFIDRCKPSEGGDIVPLKYKFVDTGMGLERIVAILQNVESNYDTDLFKTLFDVIKAKSDVKPYAGSLTDDLDINYRIMVDHCRMITVALADGLLPGREGNSYMLRSLIKKTSLLSKEVFKQEKPRYLIFDLMDETSNILSDAYHELPASIKSSRRIIAHETKRYFKMLKPKDIELANVKEALRTAPGDDSYTLYGRVNRFRSYKTFHFVNLVDGSSMDQIQLVVDRSILEKPELGSYIKCLGKLTSSPGSKQKTEFKVQKIKYIGPCDSVKYPLATKDDLSAGWYRRHIHLRPRVEHFASLLRMRSELEFAIHVIMKQLDFFRVHTPCITSNDSEASSDLFFLDRTKGVTREHAELEDGQKLDHEACDSESDDGSSDDELSDPNRRVIKKGYFKKDVFLVTSAQLHLECLAASLSRVYTISPAFRAENSLTPRHLSEFFMFEAEEANLTKLEPLLDRVETIIKFVAKYLAEVSQHKADSQYLIERYGNASIYDKLAHSRYIRMTYEDALKALSSRSIRLEYGQDICRAHELELLRHTDSTPIFITHYPKDLKPFYMQSNDWKALNFDLIAPFGGEICGGSLREKDTDKLIENLKAMKLSEEQLRQFNWYLDLRRFGTFPHGGFGIGIERLIQCIFGIKNIKDTIAFPRHSGRCPM